MHMPNTLTTLPLPVWTQPFLSTNSPEKTPKCLQRKVTVGGPESTSRHSQAKPSGKVRLQSLFDVSKVFALEEYIGVSPISKLYGPSSAMSCAFAVGPPFTAILKLGLS